MPPLVQSTSPTTPPVSNRHSDPASDVMMLTPHQASKPVMSDLASNRAANVPTEEAFYTPEDLQSPATNSPATNSPTTNSPSSMIPAQVVSHQTRTPNAPSIDPNVLIPWANEHAATRRHKMSATPNAIQDWSMYLPASPVQSNVRTTSAIQSPNDPSAQQAVYQSDQPSPTQNTSTPVR
jgi:hypothetical protein